MTNPATQEVIAQVPCATQEEMAQAVASAKAAFKTWKEVAICGGVINLVYRLNCDGTGLINVCQSTGIATG